MGEEAAFNLFHLVFLRFVLRLSWLCHLASTTVGFTSWSRRFKPGGRNTINWEWLGFGKVVFVYLGDDGDGFVDF